MTHPEYPVLRRIFLQWMFTERLVLLSVAETFFQEMIKNIDFGSDIDNEKDINVFFDFCKKAILPINLVLKKQIYVQSDSKIEYLGICNIHSDQISQVATKLNAENIDYFKKIIDTTRETSDNGLGFSEIEQIVKMSKSHIQNLLDELVENEWLKFNQSTRRYFIGPRTIFELSDYLKELSEESDNSNSNNVFRECGLCSSIVCCGKKIQCRNSGCNESYHQFCVNDYCRTTANSVCPKCQKLLDNI